MEWIFWISGSLIIYGYAGFPILIAIKAWLRPRPVHAAHNTPPIDILIAAHNEANCIAAKIGSVLDCDYPSAQLRLVVVSDGSDDGTDERIRAIDDRRVELIAVDRCGKAAALNAGLDRCHGHVVVFTDANSMFARDSLLKLIAPFADATVGAVAGDQRYISTRSESSAAAGERRYWNYDRLLKRLESRAGNAVSATGAIYAIRRGLVDHVPAGVTDDFTISTGAIAKGHRLVFAEEAVAFEPVSDSDKIEFGRKIRVMTRGFRSLILRRSLLNPFRFGFYSVQLFSHKLLRRLMVFPLLALLISSFCLWQTAPWFRLAAVGQSVFYLLALIPFTSKSLGKWKLLALPYFFCLANLAALFALFRCLCGRQVAMWDPQRGATAEN